MKILLAEDDPNIATIIKLTLEHMGGHTVVLASDGQAALETALREPFDLMILDQMMPKKNGIKVCKEIQKQKSDCAPTIFLSAMSQQSDIDEFLSCGIGYIQKPFSPTTICRLIEDILKQSPAAGAKP